MLNPFSLNKAPLKNTRKLAASVGCVDDNSTKNLVKCLKQRPARQLIEVSQSPSILFVPFASFGPVVESRREGAFVPDHPYKLLANGKINDVPWINSHTTEDGTIPGLCKYKGYCPKVPIARSSFSARLTVKSDLHRETLACVRSSYY